MTHVFECEQRIEKPIDDVFGFFSDASNLERITPSELQFRILNPEAITIARGTLIDYRLRLGGIPFRWRTEISEWNPPFQFEDTQLRGPYTMWIHRHTFESDEGATKIRDRVRYQLPLSPLSELVHPLIRMQLKRIFAFRQRAVEAFFTDRSGTV